MLAACPNLRRAVVTAILLHHGMATAGSLCTVPSAYPTIGAALADANCSEIELAAGTYEEEVAIGRSLTLRGPVSGEAIITGQVRAELAASVVLDTLLVETGCSPAVLSIDSASIIGQDLQARHDPALPCLNPEIIFEDDFE